jgi:Fe-S-cluster-containing hydrogenase component 2
LKRILVDIDRCSGCRLCEVICAFRNEKAFNPSLARITIIKEDAFGIDLPIVCWHCEKCKAMENCPAHAIERDEKGLVFLREDVCIRCKKCQELCPIGAIRFHPERETPLICHQCEGKPLCVQKCPTKALSYVETDAQQPKLPDQVIQEALRRWKIID